VDPIPIALSWADIGKERVPAVSVDLVERDANLGVVGA
jgi:hypothetical protein